VTHKTEKRQETQQQYTRPTETVRGSQRPDCVAEVC
jgi:hypothetical protein